MYLPVAIVVVALISLQASVADKVDSDVSDVYKNGGELVGFLENFKKTMRTGDSKTDVPKLDPYFRKIFDVDIKESLKLRGKLSDINAVGSSNYVVKRGDFSKSQLTANVSLSWDQLSIRSNYNASGETADGAGIWGRGYIALVIRDLRVNLNVKLAEKDGKMAVSSLSSDLHLHKFYSKITGYRDSVDASNKLTQKITNSAPKWIEDHQKVVSKYINPIVTNALNKYLQHFTLAELLKVIG